jgi:hypothetical protein
MEKQVLDTCTSYFFQTGGYIIPKSHVAILIVSLYSYQPPLINEKGSEDPNADKPLIFLLMANPFFSNTLPRPGGGAASGKSQNTLGQKLVQATVEIGLSVIVSDFVPCDSTKAPFERPYRKDRPSRHVCRHVCRLVYRQTHI